MRIQGDCCLVLSQQQPCYTLEHEISPRNTLKASYYSYGLPPVWTILYENSGWTWGHFHKSIYEGSWGSWLKALSLSHANIAAQPTACLMLHKCMYQSHKANNRGRETTTERRWWDRALPDGRSCKAESTKRMVITPILQEGGGIIQKDGRASDLRGTAESQKAGL